MVTDRTVSGGRHRVDHASLPYDGQVGTKGARDVNAYVAFLAAPVA